MVEVIKCYYLVCKGKYDNSVVSFWKLLYACSLRKPGNTLHWIDWFIYLSTVPLSLLIFFNFYFSHILTFKSGKHHDTETASLVPVLYMVTSVWFGSILRDLEEYCPSVLTTRDLLLLLLFYLKTLLNSIWELHFCFNICKSQIIKFKQARKNCRPGLRAYGRDTPLNDFAWYHWLFKKSQEIVPHYLEMI